MKTTSTQRMLMASAVLLLGAGTLWFHDGTDEAANQSAQNEQTAPATEASIKASTKPASEDKASAFPSIQTTPEAVAAAEPETVYEDNPFSSQEAKARLIQIADSYREQIQYPRHSRPIHSEAAYAKYVPNQSMPAGRPLNADGPDGPAISVKTDKHQYFAGDDIAVTTQLSGARSSSVSVQLIMNGQEIQTSDTQAAVADTPQNFRLDIPVSMHINGPTEARVSARFSIDGAPREIGTPVLISPSIATVSHTGDAYVDGEYLKIPVYVDSRKPGYHQLSANLISADAQQPLVHLSEQHELQTNQGIITLRAHIAALKAMGDEGPYLLSDLRFVRMPSPPEFTTEYGRSAQDIFEVAGFPFSDYDDVDYVDEAAQERLQFLSQLGGQ